MASLISQMRNEIQSHPQTQQLNDSIERTRALMHQVQNAPNPQLALAQILKNNPYASLISTILNSNGSLETTARIMAQSNGADINEIIANLQARR